MDKHENRYWAILFLLIGMLGALLNDIGDIIQPLSL